MASLLKNVSKWKTLFSRQKKKERKEKKKLLHSFAGTDENLQSSKILTRTES